MIKTRDTFQILVLLLLICLTTQTVKAETCSCGSYPCSTMSCDYAYCSSGDFVEGTGTCEATGFGGGICEETTDSCSADCDDFLGCVECTTDSSCNSDTYVCGAGETVYYRDYYCNIFSFTCTYTSSYLEDCDDQDGNYCADSNTRQLRNYGCSSGDCTYSVTATTECNVFDTAYSVPYCSDSYTSTKQRELGVCDLNTLFYCDIVDDYDDTACLYGCAPFGSIEYKYLCSGNTNYYLYQRSVDGFCSISNTETFSVTGNVISCGTNNFCSNTGEISIDTNLESPCELFEPNFIMPYNVIQNNTQSINAVSSQTYVPDVICYDTDDDYVYDVCHGSGCDALIQNTYCDGETCCSGSVYTTTTSFTANESIGFHYVNSLALETTQSYNYSERIKYLITETYVLASIDSEPLVIEKDTYTDLNDDSVADPSIIIKCWNDNNNKKECYGDATECAVLCPTYDYISAVLSTDYVIKYGSTGNRNINLYVYNEDSRGDVDRLNVCVYDYDNNAFCGTCSDGIKNDNEIGIDTGGRCGTCFDGIQNGVETYIDYGGNCGDCFDGLKQDFESEIDYGGVCGNCTGEGKNKDGLWALILSSNDDIPFNSDQCDTTGVAIAGVINIVVVMTLLGLFLILVFLLLAIVFLGGFLGTGISTLFIKGVEKIIKKK